MDALFGNVDWVEMFVLRTPLLEIFLRGTIIYLALFAILRLVLKRETGTVGITDLLVVVLIADAAQNAMSDGYKSIPDGILLVAVIVFWAYALEWLGYRFKAVQPFVHPHSLPLVKDGRMIEKNMGRELITEEELMGMLRQQGVEDLDEVKEARMESDGRVSVVTHGPRKGRGTPERNAR